MTQETKCPICKIRFLEALWCGSPNCPCTTQRQPTAEQRQLLKMDEDALRAPG
jgi:hypothetical protein